jgi:hypothetical protein
MVTAGLLGEPLVFSAIQYDTGSAAKARPPLDGRRRHDMDLAVTGR